MSRMIKTQNFFTVLKRLTLTLSIIFVLAQCSDEQILDDTVTAVPEAETDPATTAAATATCSSCTYIVPATANVIDGKALGLKPGAIIGLNAAYKYKNLLFRNIVGTASQPIIIKNCGGTAYITATGLSYGIKTENSKFFRITGGDVSKSYGIKVNGSHIGVTLDKLSTNFEVDHVQVSNVGFAGVMAKTDPSCDNATIRGNFVMNDISLHDNYVFDTGGEGFYVGNSFYEDGAKTSCGVRLPHEIHGVKIYNNIVKNSGWEGIQLGCATQGAQVYNNSIENYGTVNREAQNNGMQIGAGTGGLCYNNFIKNGTGNGLIVMGLGDNVVHDNVIVGAGGSGIFCDERYTPGPGFKFINNTIINPKVDGIRLYAELVPMNVVINNIIVNPGSYSTYKAPRTGNDAYVYLLSKDLRVQMSNNYFTRSITAPKFVNAGAYNYRLASGSPAINKGKSLSIYTTSSIAQDFYKQQRLKGSAYDIGAAEY